MEHASLVAQRVKRLPAMWETQVQFLAQEDPLEKEMATTSLKWNIIAYKYNQWMLNIINTYNQLIFNKRAKAIQWSTGSLFNK